MLSDLSLLSNVALPAPYTGRLTYKGELAPLAHTSIEGKLWVNCPGIYALDAWTIEAEVGEVFDASDSGSWRTRQRYEQGPPAGALSYLTVVDTSQT